MQEFQSPPQYHRFPRSFALLACSVALALLTGCQTTQQLQPNETSTKTTTQLVSEDAELLTENPTIWMAIRDGYQLQALIPDNPRVDQQRLWFASRPVNVERLSDRSSPYIYYIVEQLQARNMPLELALLPMIESAYDPSALSSAKAAGLWQFMPATGRYFNLQQTSWYDGRLDIVASTDAALDYLQYLNQFFEGDWLLALAAYNAGEGTVQRAQRRNQKDGLPTDYWNLKLPAETQAYVPKLLALSQILSTPESYQIALADVPNEPYFTAVELQHQIALEHLAHMAKLDKEEMQRLNPGYRQGVTMGGPKRILVPAEKAQKMQQQIAQLKPEDQVRWQSYIVQRGDSLSVIAKRFNSSAKTISQHNKLRSNNLRVGQVLTIPGRFATSQQTLAVDHVRTQSYTVKSGDSLSVIAQAHGVKEADLKRWNNLKNNTLMVGQQLAINQNTSNTTNNAKQPTYYQVQAGDSMYQIAQRHKVSLEQLRQWNPKTKVIHPGQRLALYL
ncbi:LysM peptidoglycan-binding domain-containing protein [Pseudomonas sp. F1_0610]|uniref:LysM peptidoglycan-binding domain-containing protein n=1 Tax=Pseudomonas sp. F1_0610 TaxID=3114284 RepID=UPI0039C32ED3